MSTKGEIIHGMAVKGAGVLIVLTVIIVTITRLTGAGDYYEPSGEVIVSASLLFEDEPEGVVGVYDAQTGARLMAYGENEGVFVRSVMRSVARQRRMRGQGSEIPVQLARYSDGQLWLIDPVSDVRFYLGAFGPDNHKAFEDILEREQEIYRADAQGDMS